MSFSFTDWRAAIVGLNFTVSPAAVLWCIWAIIVDTFDSVFGCRFGSKIVQERGEGVLPLIAHRDAASSIACVIWCVGSSRRFAFATTGVLRSGHAMRSIDVERESITALMLAFRQSLGIDVSHLAAFAAALAVIVVSWR